jgi:fluoride exporter
MMQFLWVGLGGFLGANARYLLSVWVIGRFGPLFPFHTFLINLTGSIAIGVILTLLTERLALNAAWRLFLVVGFLGGYTTFSSYTFEAIALMRLGEWTRAAWYIVGSNGLGIIACYAGIALAHAFIGRSAMA